MKRELGILAALVGVFAFAYFVPLSNERVANAIFEAFRMLQWYARNHTLACVVPAMFIAGAIGAFGGFLIPQGFALSRTLTGDLQVALWTMVGAYLLMLGVTWFTYLRRGSRMAALKV
mgnify:CR=1 FL=1